MNTEANVSALSAHWDTACQLGRIEASFPEKSWFPCGFAWLCCKTRKNSKLGKELVRLGFRWNDYYKRFESSAYNSIPSIDGMSQSMDYRVRIMQKVADYLNSQGYEFYTDCRMD